jgi:hypothetical protein
MSDGTGVIGGAAVQVNVLINSNFVSNIPGPVRSPLSYAFSLCSFRSACLGCDRDGYSTLYLEAPREKTVPHTREFDTACVSANHPFVGLMVPGN